MNESHPNVSKNLQRLVIVAAGFVFVGVAAVIPVVFSKAPDPSTVAHAEASKDLAEALPVRNLVPFVLTNSAGAVVTQEALEGKWVVANFVFSACSISCMEVNYRMREIQRLLAERSDVVLVSFTVDPRTDTPPVLARFAAQLKADTNSWTFLTGDRKQLYPVLEHCFLGPPNPKLAGIIPGAWPHVDQIAVVNPEGRLVKVFDGMKKNVARTVLASLGNNAR